MVKAKVILTPRELDLARSLIVGLNGSADAVKRMQAAEQNRGKRHTTRVYLPQPLVSGLRDRANHHHDGSQLARKLQVAFDEAQARDGRRRGKLGGLRQILMQNGGRMRGRARHITGR